jgi:hypothetical protein
MDGKRVQMAHDQTLLSAIDSVSVHSFARFRPFLRTVFSSQA